ncbi:MAG: Y-family DNA polymerase [Betaproteobacteria bacterium]
MLWMALHFYRLPLDTLERGVCSAGPLAIASSTGNGATLVHCNRIARARGIRSGMTVAAAWALASDLRIVVRDETAERAALERIAAWAIQFTPAVSLSPPGEVLLELEGSLKLFGRLGALQRRIGQEVAALGYAARLACAPTPLAAQLFSRAGFATRIRHGDALHHELCRLPIELLDHPPETLEMLGSFGVHTIGECLQLPRAETARRLGQKLLDDIDRALGRVPDPRSYFVPPSLFNASVALPAPVEQAEALLFGARRLLGEFRGWLIATGKGALRLRWMLAHERHDDTRIDMQLVAASRDPEHLLNLLRERFAGIALPRPVTAIALHGDEIEPLASCNLSFLPEVGQGRESATRLIERLQARLGEKAVMGLATRSDHRPERAWRLCRPGEGIAPKIPPRFSTRPLWLLASPKPLREVAAVPHHEGPLSLLAGPERIESGWWDGHDVMRDYFVACNPAQSLFWIYRERRASASWYLHGIFG